jgi:hypothetical protein
MSRLCSHTDSVVLTELPPSIPGCGPGETRIVGASGSTAGGR